MDILKLFGRNDTIWVIGLSRQTVTILEKNEIFTIDQMQEVGIVGMKQIKGIGPGKIAEIRHILGEW